MYDKIIDNKTFLSLLNKKIKEKSPLSVIRKGDGENIIIAYGIHNGIRLKKYVKKLRHFNIRYYDFKFQKFFRSELVNSFSNADFLGVPSKIHYHGYSSSVRKFDFEITNHFQLNKNKSLIDSHFHLEFVKNPKNENLLNPIAQKIISNKKIGIISHFQIDKFLNYHNSEIIDQFSIPKRDNGFFNKMNQKKLNFILKQIENTNNKVDLWLVAAGAYAKIFCNHIKINNGIGIDLGSAIDTWAGEYHSRKYLKKIIN